MYSNGFYNIVIYTHIINQSPESNYENDDDVLYLKTFFVVFRCANLKVNKITNQIICKIYEKL
jgi:hypothetical protein